MDDRNKRTVYCGNLSDRITEDLLYELFLQAGPLECVRIPKGRAYGFITFKHEVSVPYAVALMDGLPLYGREIRLELRSGSASQQNPYFDTISAHKQSMSHLNSPNFQPYGYNGAEMGWQESPHSAYRGNKASLLKDRYANNPVWVQPYPDPRSLLGSPFEMSPGQIAYGRERFYQPIPGRTFSPPAEPWSEYKNQMSHNHMRERNKRYY